jgi:hypothetical protein
MCFWHKIEFLNKDSGGVAPLPPPKIRPCVHMRIRKHGLRVVHMRTMCALLGSMFSVRWPKFRRLSLPKHFGQMLTSPPGRPLFAYHYEAAPDLPAAPLELIAHKTPVYTFSGMNPMRARAFCTRNERSRPREFIGYGLQSHGGWGGGV